MSTEGRRDAAGRERREKREQPVERPGAGPVAGLQGSGLRVILEEAMGSAEDRRRRGAAWPPDRSQRTAFAGEAPQGLAREYAARQRQARMGT